MAVATVSQTSSPSTNNATNLEKIESFLNDPLYKEILESSVNYNTRLCIERRMRLPFIDTQTGVAQNHSALFFNKRERMPGLLPGQIYTYPRQRWRKKRRQYLTMNSRAFARAADAMLDGEGDMHSISTIENPALHDTDSKDSQLLKDEVSKEWFYDDPDMLEMDPYDEPDQDSDLDYEESYSKRKRGKRGAGRGRAGNDSPSTPGRKKGGGRGRKKATTVGGHSLEPTPGDPDKPFACERAPGRRARQSAPPNLPPNLPAQPHAGVEDPPMPVLLPEKSIEPPQAQPGVSEMMARPPMEMGHMGHNMGHGVPHGGPHGGPPMMHGHPPGPHGGHAPIPGPPHGGHGAHGMMEKKQVPPNPYCDFCLGDSTQNKKTGTMEELVSCSDCGRSGHPTCLQFTDNMKVSVKKYRWQCIECKNCSVCGTSDNDDQLLFCDDCDRGYHMYCLSPPLVNPPEGSWSCKLCLAEFHRS